MNKIMNTITDKLSGFISSLKTDKKKLVIVVGIAVLILILLISGAGKNKKPENAGFGSQLNNVLNNEYYTGSGNLSICNNEFDITLNKNKDNFQAGIKNDNINYSGLITKFNNSLYFNYGVLQNKGDIISIRGNTNKTDTETKDAPIPVTIKDILVNIFNSEFLTYTEAENVYTASIANGENWSKFFNYAETQFSENKDSIIAGYIDKGAVREEIDNICSALKSIAASNNDANSITFVLSLDPETSAYTLSIDISLDFVSLPAFVQEKDFDTNKFTLYSTINYTFNENTVNIPSGSVKNIDKESINAFITDCWNSLFERKNYVTRSVVTEKADSVQNIISIGNTTETYQYMFDKDGVYKGTLYITSKDKEVINQYISKYVTDRENKILFNNNTKEFSITIDITETGINSLNKIATTPHGLAEYLKTAEGVAPIV